MRGGRTGDRECYRGLSLESRWEMLVAWTLKVIAGMEKSRESSRGLGRRTNGAQ